MFSVKPRPTHRAGRSQAPSIAACLVLAVITAACGEVVAAPPPTHRAAYPVRAGAPVTVGADTVEILPRGSTAFPVIASLIATARTSVHVEMYEFGRTDLASALVGAHRRGVAVTVIVDPSVDV